mgnify:CR=1 FL=1
MVTIYLLLPQFVEHADVFFFYGHKFSMTVLSWVVAITNHARLQSVCQSVWLNFVFFAPLALITEWLPDWVQVFLHAQHAAK